MISLKGKDDIDILRTGGHYLAEIFIELDDFISEGISTYDIDQFVRNKIKKRGGSAAFLGYNGFPAAVCTSINDEVIHGIPKKDVILKEGDIVGCDIGFVYKGMINDSCVTYPVGTISKDVKRLLKVCKDSLYIGIAQVEKGKRIRDIGRAITQVVSPYNYGIVRDYCGHGVGYEVHEAPTIPNYYPSVGLNPGIKNGMVLAIEPMINLGTSNVFLNEDQWTVRTADGKFSAHFEHTVAFFDNCCEIMTQI